MMDKLLQFFLGAGEGVFFAEMEAAPRLTPHADHLEICVWNSLRSSSMGIDQVRFRRQGDAVIFTARQRLVSSSQNPNRFTFSYEELDMDPARLGDYELIWQDPDGGDTGLDLDR
jgi:hypothetical protein